MHALRNIGWPAYLLCLAVGSLYMADSSWTSVTQYRSIYAFDRNFEAGPAHYQRCRHGCARWPAHGRGGGPAGLRATGTGRRLRHNACHRAFAGRIPRAPRSRPGLGRRSVVSPTIRRLSRCRCNRLFGLADQRGLRSSVFGSRFWPRAFGNSVEHVSPTSRYSSYGVSELVAWQSEYCDEALEHIAGSDAAIRVVDLQASDEAGHTYGGASDAYREWYYWSPWTRA